MTKEEIQATRPEEFYDLYINVDRYATELEGKLHKAIEALEEIGRTFHIRSLNAQDASEWRRDKARKVLGELA